MNGRYAILLGVLVSFLVGLLIMVFSGPGESPRPVSQASTAVQEPALGPVDPAPSSSKTEDPNFPLTEIAEGVFVHLGHLASIDSPLRGDSANLGVIIGESCVAVIDSGGSVTTGHEFKASISALTDKPICFVVNTHVHFDHVLGNDAFHEDKADGPQFVGHENLAAAIQGNQEFFKDEFPDELKYGDDMAGVIGPTILVDSEKTVDLGGREIVLRAHALSHTDADLTVFDPKTATLFAGDLVFRARIPVFDGSVLGWLTVLDELSKLNVSRVVPGHGPVGNSWEDATGDLVRYLSVLVADTRAAVKDGVFIEDAKDSVAATEKGKWELWDINHRRNVSRAFRELEWE